MDYREALRKLHEGHLKRALLFDGPEVYLMDDFLEKLIEHTGISRDSHQFLSVSGSEFEEASFLSFIMSIGFFSEEKLAIVTEAQDLKASDNFLKALEDLEDTRVCFFFKEKKGMHKKLQKVCDVITMERIKKQEMKLWVQKQFSLHKKRISPENIQRIIDALGYFDYRSTLDLYYMKTEIQKIASTSELEITRERITETLGRPLEENIFLILQEILDKNAEGALTHLNDYVRGGNNPYMIIPMLGKNYRQIHVLQKLQKEYFSKPAIMAKLGVKSDFVYKKLLANANHLTEKETLWSLETCTEFEAKSKQISLNMKEHVEDLILTLMLKNK